ncbi:MAG: hypothetical protein NT028_13395 [candidate division Zixibacteria bacterium]|nr:hypothetical protein [candidate division Zixibacteria bacterium]
MAEKTQDNTNNWKTHIVTAVLALIVSLIVSYVTTNYEIRRQEQDSMEKAQKHAFKLEEQLKVDMVRKWQDYRKDSAQWQHEWPLELSSERKSAIAAGFGGNLGAMDRTREAVNRKYSVLIEGGRTAIQRYEEDARLKIQTIREIGILLQ